MMTARGGSGNFNVTGNVDKVQLGNQSLARMKSVDGAMNHTMSQLRNISHIENREMNNLSPTHPPRPDTEMELQRKREMFFITKDTKPQVFDFRKTGTIQKSERGLLTEQRSTHNIISNLIDNRVNMQSQNLETKTSAFQKINQNIALRPTTSLTQPHSFPNKTNYLIDAQWQPNPNPYPNPKSLSIAPTQDPSLTYRIELREKILIEGQKREIANREYRRITELENERKLIDAAEGKVRG
jgi:hypothetical protein